MKKKLLIALTAIMAFVCCVLGLSACNNVSKKHNHEMTLVPENAATCTTDGNTAYYTCSGCDKWFADENGATEITDKTSVVIAKGHKLTLTPASSATCTTDGNTAYYTCSGCNKWFADENGATEITDKTSVVIAKGHKLTLVPASGATCTTDGNTAYYTCSGCDKWFVDENGEIEITEKSSVIITKGHTFKNGTCTVCGAHEPTEGLEYILSSDGTYYICNSIGTASNKDIFIADIYNDKIVTAISDYAFKDCVGLTSVTIPNSVTIVGMGAFEGCNNLEILSLPFIGAEVNGTINKHFGYIFGVRDFFEVDIKIPSNLKTVIITGSGIIDYEVFGSCSNLTNVIIGDNITSIGNNAFANCSALTSITIGKSVTFLGFGAFWGCSNLKSITIPDSVTSIGSSAFYNCDSLTSANIPDGVTKINERLFNGCSSLTSITIPSSVTYIGSEAFYNCSSLKKIIIPNSVLSIGKGSFSGCSSLESITLPFVGAELETYSSKTYFAYIFGAESCSNGGENIPSSLKKVKITGGNSIDMSAFYGCNHLISVTLPDSVKTIGDSAFENCSSLTSITMGKGVTSIGYRAFSECSSLTNMTLPDGVTVIAVGIFSGCRNLLDIYIPDGLTYVGEYAFNGCSSLASVTIPNSVTFVGEYAFKDCSSLQFNEYDNGLYLGNNSNKYVIFIKAKNEFIVSCTINANTKFIYDNAFYDCGKLTQISIPDKVVSIGNKAFYKCSNLTSILIPDSVREVGGGVFHNCSNLETVILSKNIITLPSFYNGNTFDGFFENCTKLISVTIPECVTAIEYGAFYGCSSLTSITFNGTIEQWNAIEKGNSWNSNTGNYTIHCTNGDLTK